MLAPAPCVQVALLLLLGCAGGGPGESPVATVEYFLSAMDRSDTDVSGLRDAYGVLDAGAKRALQERARRAGSLAGRDFEPWRMLAQGRFRLRFEPAPAGGMSARIDGDEAVVLVKGVRPGRRAEIPLVREKGGWRIKLEIPAMPKGAQ